MWSGVANFGPGDWVSFYKGKLTPKLIMTGKSKGRSMRAMKDRYTGLCDSGETRAAGMDLKALYDDLKILHDHRGGKLDSSLSWEKIVERMDVIVKYLKVVPAVLGQRVLSRFYKTCQQEQRWVEVMKVLNPWLAPVAFSARQPRLCDLPRVEEWKRLAFIQTFFREAIVPEIAEGKEGTQKLKVMVAAALESFDEVDVLALSSPVASQFRDCGIACEAISNLIELPFDSVLACQNIEKLMTATSPSKVPVSREGSLTIVQKAIKSSTFYSQRAATMRDAQAAVMERSVKKRELLQAWQGLAKTQGEACHDSAACKLLEDLIGLKKLFPSSSLEDRSVILKEMVQQHLNCGSKKITSARCDQLQKVLQEALIAFPLDTSLPALQMTLAEAKHQMSAHERMQKFEEISLMLKEEINGEQQDYLKISAGLLAALQQCHGIGGTKEAAILQDQGVRTWIEHCCVCVLKSLQNADLDVIEKELLPTFDCLEKIKDFCLGAYRHLGSIDRCADRFAVLSSNESKMCCLRHRRESA